MCLQFYLAHGLELIRIHRIVSFNQRPFMTPFMEYCDKQRKKATTDFESGLFKLFANIFLRKDGGKRPKTHKRKIGDGSAKKVRAAGKATFKGW